MKTLSPLARRVGLSALALLLGGSCSRQTFPTPSRNLDRPSDGALVCVEYEVPDSDKTCLPNPGLSDDDYLSEYCGNTGWRDLTPRVKVLPLSDCDDGNIRQRRDSFYAELRKRAKQVGRDENQPCCSDPVNNLYCDEQKAAPVCVRRTLMMLIANTVRGELAIGDTSGQVPGLTTAGRLQNLHGGTPGFGFLPVGLQPEHVRAHDSGQWAVTSNAGSCDLSLVAVDKLMPLTVRAASCDDAGQSCPTRDCDGASCPQRIEPWLPKQPTNKLRSRPAWVEIAPWAGTLSQSAIVSYPTCGVVAVVDLSGMAGEAPGKVLEAIAFDQQDPTKPPRVLNATELEALKCPLDCGGETGALAPEPMQLPAGGAMRASAYPISVAIDREGHRLLIGDALGDSITVVDYDPAAAVGSRLRPALRRIALDFEPRSEALRGDQRGINVVRIGPRSAAGLYAYAITRDNTVRIVDLDRETECETNPDPRFVQQQAAGPNGPLRVLPDEFNDSNLRRLSCLPVDRQKTPRNPLQLGPGLTLPNGSTPRDIGFVHLDAPVCLSKNPDECPLTTSSPDYFVLPARSNLWIGDFAWILGGAGTMTALQIADSCPQPSPRACFGDYAAQKRGALLHTRSQEMPSPEQQNLPGLPMAMTVSPIDRLGNVRRLVSRFDETGNTVPGPGTQSDSATGLPVFTAVIGGTQTSVQSLVRDTNRRRLSLPAPAPYYYLPVDPICDAALEPQADLARVSASDTGLPKEPRRRPVAMASFVDPASLATEEWRIEWEGIVSNLERDTGRLASDGTLMDLNGLFCARGAEPNDKLWLPGCLSNSNCPVGTTCRRDAQGSAPGLCLTNDQEQECRKWSSGLISTGPGNGFIPDSSSGAASWLRRYRIVKSEQQIQATPGGDLLDRLTLDEIPEPEFAIERALCTQKFGDVCDPDERFLVTQQRDVQAGDSRILKKLTCRATGGTIAQPEKSCIVSCESSKDCGAGFVCARSHYEELEMMDRGAKYVAGRCVRAPLIKEGTPWVHPETRAFKNMDAAEAARVIAACFPDQTPYQVRAGDAFLVKGKDTGAPTVMRRTAAGLCERPKPGDATYLASRLFQPRLRLGPHGSVPDADPQRCPKAAAQWIPHRWLPSPEALESQAKGSCSAVFRNIYLPNEVPAESIPKVVHGSSYLPMSIAECQRMPMAQGCRPADPWLNSEYELFSSLLLDSPSNQCLLTGPAEEKYPDMAPDYSSGFSLFPGDHTEMQGVRRIHFENPYGNLVMRVPRMSATLPFTDPDDPNKTVQMLPTVYWAVPPEAYVMIFAVLGGQRPYVEFAQTSQRDGLTDVLAQGLRSAVTAPSGVVYMVDEGRTGVASHLRGRILRTFSSVIDTNFILR